MLLLTVVLLIAAGGIFAWRLWAIRHSPVVPDIWEEVQRRGWLLVGTNPTYMPLSGYERDYIGLEPDIMREVARRLHLGIQFQAQGGDGQYEALELGLVDALASQIVIDPQMTGEVYYSTPYFDAGEVLVVLEKSPITGLGTLEGRSLAVELGSDGDAAARHLTLNFPAGLVLLHTDSADMAMEDLATGRAEAAIADRLSALIALRTFSGLKILPEPITQVPYAVVTRIDSPELARQIETALQGMKTDGTLDTLLARWLQ